MTPNKLPPLPERLTAAQIEAGWKATFSTTNPFCPCDLKTFTKAARWAESEALRQSQSLPAGAVERDSKRWRYLESVLKLVPTGRKKYRIRNSQGEYRRPIIKEVLGRADHVEVSMADVATDLGDEYEIRGLFVLYPEWSVQDIGLAIDAEINDDDPILRPKPLTQALQADARDNDPAGSQPVRIAQFVREQGGWTAAMDYIERIEKELVQLRADAREKGEALRDLEMAEAEARGYPSKSDRSILVSAILLKHLDTIRSALATQPAQASEADHG